MSGVGNSGKSAVVDLLREVDGLFVPEYWFEFDLIRVSGGLLDLRRCLLEDWSPIRSHAAYHAFRKVVQRMGLDPAPWDFIGLLKSTSQRYDGRFRGQFRTISLEFLEQFKIGSYKAEWPYDGLNDNYFTHFARKLARRAGLRRYNLRDVLLLDGKNFDESAREYIEQLYSLVVPADCDSIVLNNGFEPFNPDSGLDMLAARQIVVIRDPRDVYVSGLNSHNVARQDENLLAFDNDGLNKSFLATDSLPLFVKRYRLYHDNIFSGSRPDVLHIEFEKFIRDNEFYTRIIFNFLGIDRSRHKNANQFFDPAQSAKNVGMWRRYSRQDEIQYIESQLSAYLVQG